MEPGKKELNEFAEAREAFEMVFSSRAVKNFLRQELIQLQEKVLKFKDEIAAVNDNPELMQRKRMEYLKTDFMLHRLIVKSAGNQIWSKYYDGLLDRAKLYSHLTVKNNPMIFDQSGTEHFAILDAILSGDFSEAKLLFQQHMQNFKNHLIGISPTK